MNTQPSPDTADQAAEQLDSAAAAVDDRFLPRSIAQLSHAFASRESETLRQELGLGTNDWRIMATLVREPGTTASEMASDSVLSKPVISRRLAVLVELRLVDQAEGPRGSRPLTLTAKGFDVYTRMLPIAYRAQRLIERTLSNEELEVFEGLVKRLIAVANDDDEYY